LTKGEEALLDTSFIIDFLRGRGEARTLWDRLAAEGVIFACCAVNVEEVYAGMKRGEEAATGVFLRSLRYVPVTRAAARQAGKYRREFRERGVTLHTPDTLIAGVCAVFGLALVTRNADHFPMDDFPILTY
jgi:predicted nucleic acid-binding protein